MIKLLKLNVESWILMYLKCLKNNILMDKLRVQEYVDINENSHLIFTSEYFVERKPFMQTFKKDNNVFKVPQLTKGYRVHLKRRKFFRKGF